MQKHERDFSEWVTSLQRTYRVDILDYGAVQEYLTRYPKLAELIPEYAQAARVEFPDAFLELSRYCDYEEEDEYLVIYIRYSQYPPDVTNRVHAVRQRMRARQRELLGEDLGVLFLTTDFQPPETR